MPNEARLNLKKKRSLIYVSKGVIWASEYSSGASNLGSGGAQAPGAPPGSATEYLMNLKVTKLSTKM